MKTNWIVSFLCLGTVFPSKGAIVDPCLDVNHRKLNVNIGSRNELCLPGEIPLMRRLCDIYLPSDWYTADKAVILTRKPQFGTCGVDTPLWLIDPLPTVKDGIIDRDMCVKTNDDACYETVTIQIKNCTSFYVYKLQQLPDHLGCPAAYCFESPFPCIELVPEQPKLETSTDKRIAVKNTSDAPEKISSNENVKGPLLIGLTVSVIIIAILAGVVAVLVVIQKRSTSVEDADMSRVPTGVSGNARKPTCVEDADKSRVPTRVSGNALKCICVGDADKSRVHTGVSGNALNAIVCGTKKKATNIFLMKIVHIITRKKNLPEHRYASEGDT